MEKTKGPQSGLVAISLDAKRYLKDRLAVFGVPLEKASEHGLVALSQDDARREFDGQPVGAGIGFIYGKLDGNPGRIERIRELPSAKARARRYVSRKGSSVSIYLPRANGINWEAVSRGSIPRLLIVEGELKALACCLAGEYAVGIGGVTMWGDSKGALHPILRALISAASEVIVIFDSDTSSNKKVAAQFRKLLGAIHKEGKRGVGIVTPGKHGAKVGIDDYIFANGPKEAETRLKALIEEGRGTISKLMEALNEKWKWIEDKSGHRIIEITEDQLRILAPRTFNEGKEVMLLPTKDGKAQMRSVSSWWMEQPEKETYSGTILCPFEGAVEPRSYNLYLPLHKPDVVPDVRPLYRYLEEIWGKEGARWLQCWWAYYFQQRMRPTWAPYITGPDEGTGKTMCGRIWLAPLGYRYLKLDLSIGTLMGSNFGAEAFGSHLGFALEEGAEDDRGGRKAREFLKLVLDAPTLSVEPKYVPRYSTPNRHAFYLSGNSSRLVHIDQNDRRFFYKALVRGFRGAEDSVRKQCNEILYGSQNYKSPIREDVSWALRRNAERMKIPDTFDPARAPMTADKLLLIESDRSNLEHEVQELVTKSVWCGRPVGEVYDVQALVTLYNARYGSTREVLHEGTLRHCLREESLVPIRAQVKGPPAISRILWCHEKSLPKLSKLSGRELLEMGKSLTPVASTGEMEKPKTR